MRYHSALSDGHPLRACIQYAVTDAPIEAAMASSVKLLDRPQLLSDQAYAALRDQLRSGQFSSGRPLAETSLAVRLGVTQQHPGPDDGDGVARGRSDPRRERLSRASAIFIY